MTKLTFQPEVQRRAVPRTAICKSRRKHRKSSGADTVTTGGEDAAKPKVEDNTEEGQTREIVDVLTLTGPDSQRST